MKRPILAVLATSCLLTSYSIFSHAADVDAVVKKTVEANKEGIAAQKQVEKLDGEVRALSNQYQAIVAETQGLDLYLQQIEKQMSYQDQELTRLKNSLENVQGMQRDITPLILRMIDGLESFVKLDVPFQREDRLGKIAELRALMTKSDVSVAERYRKVLEAYQDEIEYSRTLETYAGPLSLDGKERSVDFLRVGRVSFVYMTKDGKEMGVWNAKTDSWQPLDASSKNKIVQAMRIAGEQAAPSLIRVPLNAPIK